MHELRGCITAKASVERYFQFILIGLFTELYNHPHTTQLEFPSDDVLDMLEVYEGGVRKKVADSLKAYGYEIQCLWEEYCLTSLMALNPYLNCATLSRGDILLRRTPKPFLRTEHELSV